MGEITDIWVQQFLIVTKKTNLPYDETHTHNIAKEHLLLLYIISNSVTQYS